MAKHFIDRDKVMDRREFYRLPRSDQRSLMATWRLTKSTEQIKKEMNLSTTAFYSLLKRLDLPTNLKAYRDASPSLLGEDKPKQIESKMNSKIDSNPSDEIECQIGLIGHVKINELTDVLEFAKEHHLELTLNATK